MKKLLLTALATAIACAAVVLAVFGALAANRPDYAVSVDYDYYPEKLKGNLILSEAAGQGDTLFLFGSSELNTTMIESHPTSFFTENDFGFDVCLVGRGSCQSLIHAINLAGNADSLKGQKVVLICSPQHFIPTGIEPDMFVANFSQQQYLQALGCDSLSDDVKARLSRRVTQCLDRYEAEEASLSGYESTRLAASLAAGGSAGRLGLALVKPYYALESATLAAKDRYDAYRVIQAAAQPERGDSVDWESFDWAGYREDMTQCGKNESEGNDFGILADYYQTNVGSRLARMENKDAELSYTDSVEYDDLTLLMDICSELELDVMYVSIPLHGAWSDFTGFAAERRQEYYDKVSELVSQYPVRLLDLTSKEYDDYYLCDVMHLGWLGWVDINEAICEFYYEDK